MILVGSICVAVWRRQHECSLNYNNDKIDVIVYFCINKRVGVMRSLL